MNVLQAENEIVNTWPDSGPARQEDGLRNHVDLVQMLDIVDMDAGTTVAGACCSHYLVSIHHHHVLLPSLLLPQVYCK